MTSKTLRKIDMDLNIRPNKEGIKTSSASITSGGSLIDLNISIYKQPVFYIHPEHDRLIWLAPKQKYIDLADRLKLEEYLMAYGSQVDMLDRTGVPETSAN